MSGAEAISNRRFCAKNGMMSAIAGSLLSLGLSIGTEPDASNRMGFYSDLTPAGERLGIVVAGTEMGHCASDRLEIVQDIYAGNDLSASKGFSGTQTLGVNQTIQDDLSNSIVIGDIATLLGSSPSQNNVLLGWNSLIANSLEPGFATVIGAGAYAKRGRVTVLGAGAGADRAFSVAIGRSAYTGGSNNVAVGDLAFAGGTSVENATAVGKSAYANASEVSALGATAGSDALGGVALGYLSYVEGVYGIALGHSSYAPFDYSVAIGQIVLG